MFLYLLILALAILFLLNCYWFVVGLKARNVGIFQDDRHDNDQR